MSDNYLGRIVEVYASLLQGGINTSVKDGAIYVKSLYPNGPADLAGRIQVGHKIISVNGIGLQGVTHKQVIIESPRRSFSLVRFGTQRGVVPWVFARCLSPH